MKKTFVFPFVAFALVQNAFLVSTLPAVGGPNQPNEIVKQPKQALLHPATDTERDIENDLLPSKPDEGMFIVEITRNYMKFETLGYKPQEVSLKADESEEIQKLSLKFVKLLNSSKLSGHDESDAEVLDWRDLNPVITISSSGISVRFVKMAEPSTTCHEDKNRFVYWKFVLEFAKNAFDEKLKKLNVTLDEGEDGFESWTGSSNLDSDKKYFQKFLNTLWKIMEVSIDYAVDNFNGWQTVAQTVS